MPALGVGAPPETRALVLPRHESLKGDKDYNSDNTPFWKCRVYNATGGALVKNTPYLLTFSGASATAQNPRATALAAVVGAFQQVVIAAEAIPNNSWGWVVFQGYFDCGIEGTTDVAAGDFLLVSAGVSTTGLVKDGTTRTSQSCAIACEAQAANSVVTKRVYLLGDPCLTSPDQGFSSLTIPATGTTVFEVESDGDVGIGAAADASYRLLVERSSNSTLMVNINNPNTGTGAGSIIHFAANGLGGSIGCYPSNFAATAELQDRLAVRLDSDASGIVLYAPTSGQDVRIHVGSSTLSYTFAQTLLTFGDAVNIAFNATTGTKIGTATTQKLAFYNATPIVQPSAWTQTFATADKTHAARTATTLTMTDGAGTNDNTIGAITADASVIAAFQEVVDEVNKLIADLADTAQAVNALIDDQQALGLAA